MSLEPKSIPYKSEEILFLSKEHVDNMKKNAFNETKIEDIGKSMGKSRKDIKEASDKMTKTWKNTFSGYHAQRLKENAFKKKQTEVMRIRTDDLEEQYQEIRKKYVLGNSSRELYNQTDRAKTLNSAMKLTEAVGGRKEQIEEKREINRIYAKMEDDYAEAILANKWRFKEEDIAKKQQLRKEAKIDENFLKDQMNFSENIKEKERVENFRQRRLLDADLIRQQTDVLKTDYIKNQKKQQYKQDLDNDMRKKLEIQDALEQLEKAEETRTKLFFDAKSEMKKISQQKGKEIRRLQEECKTNISTEISLEEELRNKREEKILRKAIKQKKLIEDQQIKKKEEARQKTLKEINDFYHKKVEENKETKFRDKVDRLTGNYLTSIPLKRNEIKECAERKKAAKEAQHILYHQIAKRRHEMQQEEAKKNLDYLALAENLKEEEDTFQKYAALLINECEAKGFNTYPMKKAAEPGIEFGQGLLFKDRCNIRPKYYSSDAKPNDLDHVKRKNFATIDTKGRLGFIGP